MSTLFLCGAGNSEGVRLALRVNDATGRWDRIVLLDDDEAKEGKSLLGVRVEGGFDLLESMTADDEVQNLVTRTCMGRSAARRRIETFTDRFATLISPDVDTLGAMLDSDCTVYPGAVLGPETSLAAGSVVWMGAIVGHESDVDRGSIVAANAVLNARVRLGEEVYVGTNATVLPEITIGAGATVAAGSVVVTDVPAGATALGVPAEIVEWAGVRPVEQAPDDLEAHLVKIFQRVLGQPDLRAEDDFFAFGGSSLQAMKLKLEIEKVTDRRLSLLHVMRNPSPRALAVFLDEALLVVND